MSFFNRRRDREQISPVPDNQPLNLTNYVEKTVIPTDAQSETAVGAATTAVMDNVSSVRTETERPMVFVSKEHSGIYIYEYSDRLEYYVKTATCMYKFDTVAKTR